MKIFYVTVDVTNMFFFLLFIILVEKYEIYYSDVSNKM